MKALIVLLALGLTAQTSAQASAFELVSQSEYRASEAQEKLIPPFNSRSTPAPSDPVIEVRSPSLTAPIKAPVGIDLRFLTSGAAKINWDSLKILYGAFKLDITERVKREAKIVGDGMQIPSANLPSGNHKLVIQVANTEGKQTEREVRFTVE